jgi:hypothetical protein
MDFGPCRFRVLPLDASRVTISLATVLASLTLAHAVGTTLWARATLVAVRGGFAAVSAETFAETIYALPAWWGAVHAGVAHLIAKGTVRAALATPVDAVRAARSCATVVRQARLPAVRRANPSCAPPTLRGAVECAVAIQRTRRPAVGVPDAHVLHGVADTARPLTRPRSVAPLKAGAGRCDNDAAPREKAHRHLKAKPRSKQKRNQRRGARSWCGANNARGCCGLVDF